ncbi:MAG: lysophospholipid acyltransferase family protein, partial [Stellaceae bacterium]
IRALLRSEAGLRLYCWLVKAYVRIVYRTSRWTIEGAAFPQAARAQSGAFILAFWHGRLLMMPMAWQRLAPMHMLISAHVDGRLIAGAVRYFDIDSVAGSSNDGGSQALRAMVRWLKSGNCVGITPDGPDGPAMRASRGIVAVARLAGAPVVPLAYATRRRRILASWDRFHLPLPFTHGIFIWGEPTPVAGELDDDAMEECRAAIEERLNRITAEADRRMGHAAVAPGTMDRAALREVRRAAGSR